MFVFCVSFLCVCVCGFFWWMGRVFFNGRRVCGSLQLYQRQEFNKHVVACVVCNSVSRYGTYFLIIRVYCGFRPKQNICFSSLPVPQNRAAPVFLFIFSFTISRQKTAQKHFRARAVTFAIVWYGKMSRIRVQVICGVKLLRPWYGSIVPESITIADLFDMVQTGIFDCGPPIINSPGLLDENDDSQWMCIYGPHFTLRCECVYVVLTLYWDVNVCIW